MNAGSKRKINGDKGFLLYNHKNCVAGDVEKEKIIAKEIAKTEVFLYVKSSNYVSISRDLF